MALVHSTPSASGKFCVADRPTRIAAILSQPLAGASTILLMWLLPPNDPAVDGAHDLVTIRRILSKVAHLSTPYYNTLPETVERGLRNYFGTKFRMIECT